MAFCAVGARASYVSNGGIESAVGPDRPVNAANFDLGAVTEPKIFQLQLIVISVPDQFSKITEQRGAPKPRELRAAASPLAQCCFRLSMRGRTPD